MVAGVREALEKYVARKKVEMKDTWYESANSLADRRGHASSVAA